MSWIQTYLGRQFFPLDPNWQAVDIHDIAHALSNLCRYGGHTESFYSVAQHSVLVSLACDPQDAFYGLLHDASEAYLVDVPRPIKHSNGMAAYREAENALEHAIAIAFGLPREMPPSVKRADNILLVTEQRDLMKSLPAPWTDCGVEPLAEEIQPWLPQEAKARFLRRFDQLRTIPAIGTELGYKL